MCSGSRVRLAVWLASTAWSVVWVGSVQAQAGTVFEVDRPWVVEGFRVPVRADTFALLSARRWPELSLGVSLQYYSPISSNASLSLYVYPIPPERAGEVAAAMLDEFDRAVRAAFDEQAAARAGVAMGLREAAAIELADGRRVGGMWASGALNRGSDSQVTSVWVFTKEDHFFKYRVTHRSRDFAQLMPHVEAWMRLTYEGVERVP